MDKNFSQQLAERIRKGLRDSSRYCLEKTDTEPMDLPSELRNKERLFDGLISCPDEKASIWLFITIWRLENPGCWYLMIWDEKLRKILAEIHKVENSDLVWKYIPRKRDGKNAARKEKFVHLIGCNPVTVSPPDSFSVVNDFLENLFRLANIRAQSDELG